MKRIIWQIMMGIVVVGLVVGFIAAVFKGAEQEKQERVVNCGSLETVLHDGHWFVIVRQQGAINSVCHHPDCPKCKKGVTNEVIRSGF